MNAITLRALLILSAFVSLCAGLPLHGSTQAQAIASNNTHSAAGKVSSEAREVRPLLAPALGSHMVLQRGKPNRFWGWAEPGEKVRLGIEGSAISGAATTDASGKWLIEFAAPPVGGPYRIRINAEKSGRTEVLEDVLCGDVWLCGGQSNMNFALRDATGGKEAATGARLPKLRLFRVAQQVAYEDLTTVSAQWKLCTPAEAEGFSAVAFFFGRRLQADLDIPIGLVQSAVGGSPIESWMGPESLGTFPEFAPALSQLTVLNAGKAQRHGSFLMHWLEENDAGTRPGSPNWADPALDDKDWTPVLLPTAFADLGIRKTAAIAWFRLRVTLPSPLPKGKARLLLGVVDKMDTSFINGHWVGASSWVENPRNYTLADEILRPGENLIAIRVVKLAEKGGFRSPTHAIKLILGDGTEVPLCPLGSQGDWKGRLSHDARPPAPLPLDEENYPTMPTVLRAGMIAPLAPLAITGAVWYQGEANFTRATQYRRLLPALIKDWRTLFHCDDKAPFIIVGLPAFMQRRDSPGDDGWAELRDAQGLAARSVPGALLATTMDTGDANDIHPKDKALVGDRAALAALGGHYGKAIPFRGPVLEGLEQRGDALILRFAHTEGGLVAKAGVDGKRLPDFSIAGENRRWYRAEASIEGNTVVLRCPHVAFPVAARYAWQANPEACLFNGAGLPAAPFRTDDWPLSTK